MLLKSADRVLILKAAKWHGEHFPTDVFSHKRIIIQGVTPYCCFNGFRLKYYKGRML